MVSYFRHKSTHLSVLWIIEYLAITPQLVWAEFVIFVSLRTVQMVSYFRHKTTQMGIVWIIKFLARMSQLVQAEFGDILWT